MTDVTEGSSIRRVLIVEDDFDIRDVLGVQLRRQGYDVLEAEDGEEALAILHREGGALPDVILLDLMMPRVDGWAFCERRQSDPRLASIPIILMSAFGDRAQLPPASAFLTKPFEVDDLTALLDRVGRDRER